MKYRNKIPEPRLTTDFISSVLMALAIGYAAFNVVLNAGAKTLLRSVANIIYWIFVLFVFVSVISLVSRGIAVIRLRLSDRFGRRNVRVVFWVSVLGVIRGWLSVAQTLGIDPAKPVRTGLRYGLYFMKLISP